MCALASRASRRRLEKLAQLVLMRGAIARDDPHAHLVAARLARCNCHRCDDERGAFCPRIARIEEDERRDEHAVVELERALAQPAFGRAHHERGLGVVFYSYRGGRVTRYLEPVANVAERHAEPRSVQRRLGLALTAGAGRESQEQEERAP